MFERRFNHLARQPARFTNATAANCISRETDINSPRSRFAPQVGVHPTLHDPKQRLGRSTELRPICACVVTGLCPVHAGRSPATTRPRYLIFMLLKILFAPCRPSQR